MSSTRVCAKVNWSLGHPLTFKSRLHFWHWYQMRSGKAGQTHWCFGHTLAMSCHVRFCLHLLHSAAVWDWGKKWEAIQIQQLKDRITPQVNFFLKWASMVLAGTGPSAPPSTMSATPATQNDGGCEFVPRLPRETKVDGTKCQACHAKCRGVTGDKSGPSAPPSTMSATPATQNDGGCEVCATRATWNEGGCHQVPRLPRKVPRRHRRQIRTKRATQYHECHACHAKRRWMRVLCHACHVKRGWMSPSATPATQSAAASQATNPDQARHPVPWVPRLPRKTTVDASLCHACHVKRRWMSPSATPATQSAAASQATNPDQARHPVPWVPRLPRKTTVDASFVPRLPRETKVDVTKCHACHAKCRGVTGDKSGPSAPPSTMSATPATQNDGGCEFCATPATWNEGGCHQVPRLPRKAPRRHRRQIRTKRASQYHECHACHAKRRWMRVCATQTKADVTKCHACHAKCCGVTGDKSGPSAPPSTMSATPATQNDGGCEFCATPATWNEGGCHQVPRLPHKVPRRHRRQIRTKRATQYHECHACHAKRRCVCVCVKWLSVKFAYVKFVCVKFVYVKFVYVKLLYVKFVCVKLLYVKFVCVKFVIVC